MDADLVLEGGGVKGIALVGAFSILEEAGYRFHRIAGTSAGAIVGALIASNMPVDRIRELMRELDYMRFEDETFLDHLGMVGKAANVLFEKGIYRGEYLKTWLGGVLEEAGVRTFADLRLDDPGGSLPPERSYRLVVMASDITRGELIRFPWDYARYGLDPDEQLVADAVRCSMSIPFFYEPVRLEWAEADGAGTTSYIVDGGMLSNFPIEVFDRTDGKPPRWPTFGLKLSAKRDAMQAEKFAVHGAVGLARAMLGTMTSFHDQMHIGDPCVLARTMFVDTMHVKATAFDIDEATQDLLYQNGRKAATDFLSSWNFETYVAQCRTQ